MPNSTNGSKGRCAEMNKGKVFKVFKGFEEEIAEIKSETTKLKSENAKLKSENVKLIKILIEGYDWTEKELEERLKCEE